MDRQIEEVAAVCDMVRGRKRSNKRLWLSFDEWNVWYRQRDGDGHKQEAPRLLEEVYNLEDALIVGGTLNTLLRHSDRVRIACLAQLVNVIAPLVTNADGVLQQTIYHPYAWALEHARGNALGLSPDTETYDVPRLGAVPYLDVAGTHDPETRRACLLILNRDLEKARDLEVTWRETVPRSVLALQTLTGADLMATNTFEEPKRVVPQALEPPEVGARMTVRVPARSYTTLVVALG
jgi:alpha-N-arabinofuranosidase